MFDIGWQELFLIALITIIVVGPKELPGVLRTVTLWIRKVRSMAREFQDGMEDLARETELDDLKREIEDSATGNLEDHIENTIDPTGEMGEAVREIGSELETDPLSPDRAAEKRSKASPSTEEATTTDAAPETAAGAPETEDVAPSKKAGGAG